MNTIRISIIVPVLNEAATVAGFLRHVRGCAPDAGIIVVDGGSRDGTPDLAQPWCDKVMASAAGRATQMNAGARLASGDALWFLHADSGISEACLEALRAALDDPGVAGGCFRIRIPRRQVVYRVTDAVAHYAGLLFRVRCGDHGIFCRRAAFERVGGYRDVPLMEDAEFFRALYGVGKVRVLPLRILTSPRRYEQIGPWRLTFAYLVIATLYTARIPPGSLAALYRRICIPQRAGQRF